MAEYEPVIGLEVHAQLLTRSKIFCGCSTLFGAPPNSHTCPVCLGLPGALPVVNREAIGMAVKAGLALGCSINSRSVFARKNYFYPDLPKGYQISQFDLPLAVQGRVEVNVDDGTPAGSLRSFRIHRIHLEDDAGKSVHVPGGDTGVNLNRTGVPLVEIVTEADFRSSQEAYDFMTCLRQVLLYLGVCDGNMEEGSLRCDANVSLRPVGETKFGVKAEIKNVNSFRFLRKALDYEIERQRHVLSSGGTIVQETRLWDEDSQTTQSMRSKEEAHDYRYFPDPDLLPVVIPPDWLEELRKAIPELPAPRRERFISQYGLETEAAGILTQSREFADWFEAAVGSGAAPVKVANWMVGDLLRELNREGRAIADSPIAPADLGALVRMVESGSISGRNAKEVFARMYETGRSADSIVADLGLRQISSAGELEAVVDEVLGTHPDEVAAYRGGKEGLVGFFVGQVMKRTRGQANAKLVNELLRQRLSS